MLCSQDFDWDASDGSLKNTNQQFLTFKHNTEKHNLNFTSDNTETNNKPFT